MSRRVKEIGGSEQVPILEELVEAIEKVYAHDALVIPDVTYSRGGWYIRHWDHFFLYGHWMIDSISENSIGNIYPFLPKVDQDRWQMKTEGGYRSQLLKSLSEELRIV